MLGDWVDTREHFKEGKGAISDVCHHMRWPPGVRRVQLTCGNACSFELLCCALVHAGGHIQFTQAYWNGKWSPCAVLLSTSSACMVLGHPACAIPHCSLPSLSFSAVILPYFDN